MSIWLSGVNTAANTVRGAAMAQARRNAASAAKNVTEDFFTFWAGAVPPAANRNRRKKRPQR